MAVAVIGYFLGWWDSILNSSSTVAPSKPTTDTPAVKQNIVDLGLDRQRATGTTGATGNQQQEEARGATGASGPVAPTTPEVDCSDATYDTFCKDPVYQIRNCKTLRSPVATDQQDLESVRDCGIRGMISAEKYAEAKQYFTSKNLVLAEQPDVDCMNSTFDNFCKNPASQLRYCKSIKSPPTTDQEDLVSVRDCGLRNLTPDDQYIKAKQYFSEKGLRLIDKPDVDCLNSTFDNFCKNPASQLRYCKPIKSPPTTDEEDLVSVTDCGLRNLTSNDEYTKAQLYFKEKIMTLPNKPDVDCMDATFENYCKNPASQLRYCKPIKSPKTTDQQDLVSVTDCGVRNLTSNDEYTKAQLYFKEKGLALPNKPDVDCLNATFDNFCKNPASQLQFCKAIKSQTTDQQDLDAVIDCGVRNLTPDDQYTRAQQYFSQKGMTLPNKPDVDCMDSSPANTCKNPASQFQYCKSNRSQTTDQQDLDFTKSCALQGLIPADQYTRAQQYFSQKHMILPDRPDIECSNSMYDYTTYFCKYPTTQLKYCKPLKSSQTTDQQDLDSVKDCMTKKMVTPDEYQKVKDYFATKNMTLPDYISISCASCPQYQFFCNNLNMCMKCKEASNEGGAGVASSASISAGLQCPTYYPNASADFPLLAQRYPQFAPATTSTRASSTTTPVVNTGDTRS